MTVIVANSLRFAWPGSQRPVLDIASFGLEIGERVLVRGPSGSGKSTLLAAIAGTVEVAPQMLTVCGRDIGSLRNNSKDRFRADHLGMIYQLFNLLPYLNAVQNVMLPCRFSRRRREAIDRPEREARRLLAEMGLVDERLLCSPAAELSVGQQQRVAAARALIGRPALILADEPTSALDPASRDAFLDLMLRECQAGNTALLCVSHDPAVEQGFDRCVNFSEINHSLGLS